MLTIHSPHSLRKHNYRKNMKYIGHKEFWQEVDAGLWESETFKVLKDYCKKDKIFIDIGAWNGVCSLFAAELGSICYAIEPDHEALKFLRKNVELNDGVIHIRPICIAGHNGLVNLHTQYENGFGNSMSSILKRGVVAETIEVESKRLSDFIQHEGINIQDVCLIKIDIEGGEIELINQAEPFLSEHKPTIYISLHPAWFPNGDEDVNLIADIIFNIYRVYDTADREYQRDNFLEAVNSNIHSFILRA